MSHSPTNQRAAARQYTPVKECALSHGIEVFQPVKIRETANIEYLRKFNADIIIVVAFGQILSKSILDMPRYGCINVHASLLPKYRGVQSDSHLMRPAAACLISSQQREQSCVWRP